MIEIFDLEYRSFNPDGTNDALIQGQLKAISDFMKTKTFVRFRVRQELVYLEYLNVPELKPVKFSLQHLVDFSEKEKTGVDPKTFSQTKAETQTFLNSKLVRDFQPVALYTLVVCHE